MLHLGKFAVFYNKELVDTFDSFDNAAEEAIKRFGKGPYLIRQVKVEEASGSGLANSLLRGMKR